MQQQAPIEFINRLENWGASFRNGGGTSGTSPTYRFCRALAIQKGALPLGGSEKIIDEDDARIIEWCFGRSEYRMVAKHRAIILAWYVNQVDQRDICRTLRMKLRFFTEERNKAEADFYRVVTELEHPERFHKLA